MLRESSEEAFAKAAIHRTRHATTAAPDHHDWQRKRKQENHEKAERRCVRTTRIRRAQRKPVTCERAKSRSKSIKTGAGDATKAARINHNFAAIRLAHTFCEQDADCISATSNFYVRACVFSKNTDARTQSQQPALKRVVGHKKQSY